MNFFGAKEEQKSLKDPEQQSGGIGGVFRQATGFFNSTPEEPKTCKDKMLSYIEVETSYTSFLIVLAIGCGVLFLSMMFLPLILIKPNKFISLFSLGSILVMSSFIFIQGTKSYFSSLFSKERYLFTTLYLASIICGIYFSFNNAWFFIAYFCVIFQFIALTVFIFSFIPGGQIGISYIFSYLKSFIVKS